MVQIKFQYSEKDVVLINVCACCNANKFIKLSDVSSISSENTIKTFLETSVCVNCGHIFRSKILSEEWMLKMFSKRDKIQSQAKFNPINQKVEELRYKRYRELGLFTESFFSQSQKKNFKILDFGCGPGTGIKAFIDLGFLSEGVEPDVSRAKYGIKNGIPIKEKTWQDYKIDNFTDHLFTSIQSLEHFYNAEKFIEKISKNMSVNSLLYLEVPDANNHIKDWNDSLYLGHVHNFCENSLLYLLNRLGFQSIKRCKPYSNKIMNRENICIFASKKKGIWTDTLENLNSDKIKEYVNKKRTDSIINLQNEPILDEKISFFVEEINDLMFSFKDSSTINEKIKDNQSQRKITFIKQNFYKVGY